MTYPTYRIALTDAGNGDEIAAWASAHTDYHVNDLIDIDDRLTAVVTERRWSGPYQLTLALVEVGQ
jgi:hypothetical protein